MDGAGLLGPWTEEGCVSRNAVPREAGKGQESDSPPELHRKPALMSP